MDARVNDHRRKKVYMYELDGSLVGEFDSYKNAAFCLKVSKVTIRRFIKNKSLVFGLYFLKNSRGCGSDCG